MKWYLVIVCCFLLGSNAFAEKDRRSFSYLGAGIDFIDYSENTEISSQNLTINSEATGEKFSRRAGGFVAYNSDWGFYVNNGSTWGTRDITESWDINGTEVQRDNFAIRRSELLALAVRKIKGKHHALVGLGSIETSFTRYAWSYPDQDRFIINERGADENLNEDISQIIFYTGYEYNEFYLTEEAGLRYQLQALVGLPIYAETLNSTDGDTRFTANFDGFVLRAVPSVGWQFDKNFMVTASLDISLNHRSEDRIENGSSLKILPENKLFVVAPAITGYWSF